MSAPPQPSPDVETRPADDSKGALNLNAKRGSRAALRLAPELDSMGRICDHSEMRTSVHLRIPMSLIRALRKRAAQEQVSLNTLLVSIVAGAIGYPIEEGERD